MEKPSWGPLLAVLGTIGITILSQVTGLILLLAVGRLAGHSPDELETNNYLRQPGYIFLGALFVCISLFAMTYALMRRAGATLQSIGVGSWRWKYVLQVLAGYGLYFLSFVAVASVVQALAPHWLDQNQDVGFSRQSQGPVLGLIFITLVILPPLFEEFLFRGFLYTGLRSRLNIWWATIITSVMFATAHLFGGETSALLWIAAVDTFVLSVILCQLRERSGSLWPPVGLHMLKNLVVFAALFLRP